MSLETALDLVLCGVLLAGFSVVAQFLQPDFQRATWLTGVVGGGLCALWGVLGRLGTRCRGAAMLTLGLVACVFGVHVLLSAQAAMEGKAQERTFLLIMILLMVFCVGMLANLVREGKRPQP
jgi:peptidoglycan/LPS O-acetylase OafA/YrhL